MSAAYYRILSTYLDTSSPGAPVLYVCTLAGDKTTSVWAQISGGGGYMGEHDETKAYAGGQTVRVSTPKTVAGVNIGAGLYGVPPGVSVPAGATGYQLPQDPEPTAFSASPNDKVYWHVLVRYCGV